MRSSRVVVPLTLVALVLTGCSSNNAVRNTITSVVTVDPTDTQQTGSPVTPSDVVTIPGVPGATTGSDVTGTGTVVDTATATAPPATETADTGTETAPTTETSETTETGADFTKVNPLKADCNNLLSVSKIKSITGQTVPGKNNRIVDIANPERKITGRLKCQFGVKGDNAAVTVNLTQFKTAAAADAQIATTVDAEDSLGGKMSTGSVKGYPAQIALRDGGLIVFRYDTWTLSVVAAKSIGSNSELPDFLTKLAEAALAKVIG